MCYCLPVAFGKGGCLLSTALFMRAEWAKLNSLGIASLSKQAFLTWKKVLLKRNYYSFREPGKDLRKAQKLSGNHKIFREIKKAGRKSQILPGIRKIHREISKPYGNSENLSGNPYSFREITNPFGNSQIPPTFEHQIVEQAVNQLKNVLKW